MIPVPRSAVLGAVLAGGRSRRFGSDKAFAELGGESLVRRAARSLDAAAGPLGGLYTAVSWAAEEEFRGVLVLATDMPFVPPSLLRTLAARLDSGVAVVPKSSSRRGCEPLCAAYDVACLPAIEAAIERGDRAVVSFFADVEVLYLDLADVSSHGDPDRIFFNVNRPDDGRRADELLAEGHAVETETGHATRSPEEQ
jgi:molybdopterin-guanine dinucleotide biosynthesis protein A